MPTRRTWGVAIISALLVLGGLAYLNREAIVLKAVGFAVKQRIPVGPFQDISWSTGADPQGRGGRRRRVQRQKGVGASRARRDQRSRRDGQHSTSVPVSGRAESHVAAAAAQQETGKR